MDDLWPSQPGAVRFVQLIQSISLVSNPGTGSDLHRPNSRRSRPPKGDHRSSIKSQWTGRLFVAARHAASIGPPGSPPASLPYSVVRAFATPFPACTRTVRPKASDVSTRLGPNGHLLPRQVDRTFPTRMTRAEIVCPIRVDRGNSTLPLTTTRHGVGLYGLGHRAVRRPRLAAQTG